VHTAHWLATAAGRRWAVQSYEETVRKPIGLWLARNTPPDAVISMEPIGYIGYYSHRKILDEVGLVSPGVIKFNRHGAGWFAGMVKAYHPDYIVERPHFLMTNKTLNTGVRMFASPAERDWFWAHYRRVRDFPCSGSRSFRAAYSFVILKRLGGADHARQTADGSKAGMSWRPPPARLDPRAGGAPARRRPAGQQRGGEDKPGRRAPAGQKERERLEAPDVDRVGRARVAPDVVSRPPVRQE